MKLSKILFLSAAAIFSLASCGGNVSSSSNTSASSAPSSNSSILTPSSNVPSSEPSGSTSAPSSTPSTSASNPSGSSASASDHSGTSSSSDPESSSSSSMPAPQFSEVNFKTFKENTLNLPESPYDLVSVHYHAFGSQGTYPIDIDKTVTLTKKISGWKIDVPTTHHDYACASQCKQMLDVTTLENMVSAGEPTDGTSAKFYFNSELGFKIVTNSTFADNGDLFTSDTTVIWNKYGDLLKDDVHTIDTSIDPESGSDVHVIGDFSYSTKAKPDPMSALEEKTEIEAIQNGLRSTMDEENITVNLTMTEEMPGVPGEPDKEIAVLEGDEAYLMDINRRVNYETITKKDDKYIDASFSSDSTFSGFRYVDQNHARNKVIDRFFNNGLTECVDYLAYYGSFEKLADYTVLKTLASGEFGAITKDDYVVKAEKETVSSNVRTASITIEMKDEWLSGQTMQGMQMSQLILGISFTYDDEYLLSFSNLEVISVLAMGSEMTIVGDVICEFDNKADQEIKGEILDELAKRELPETIYNAYTDVYFAINGYEIGSSFVEDYTKGEDGLSFVNSQISSPDSQLNGVLSSLGNEVTLKYFYNGKEVDNFSNITLSSYENVFNVEIVAKDEEKCAVFYVYEKRIYGEYGYSHEVNYKGVLVDKTDSYAIETSFAGESYSDMFGTVQIQLSEPIYDLSNSDSATFICIQIVPYIPGPLSEKTFFLDEISNYEEIKDIVIEDETTIGDKLDELTNCILYFESGDLCYLSLENGQPLIGYYEDELGQGTYSVNFHDPNNGVTYFSWEFSFDSESGTIAADYAFDLEDGGTIVAHLLFTLI